MTINKFQGKTESEAIEKAKKEMGPDVVIMSVKTVKPKGVFRAFKGIVYEVTAALEENEADKVSPFAQTEAAQQMQMKKPESINLTADENIRIPAVSSNRIEETAGRVLQQLQKQNENEAPDRVQPQPQASSSFSSANTCPISPPAPFEPLMIWPSMMMPPPTPVPRVTIITF